MKHALVPFFILLLGATSGCTSRPTPQELYSVQPSAYIAEQVHAICYSEALNIRAAVRATGKSQPNVPDTYRTNCNTLGSTVSCNTTAGAPGFASGFAKGFNKSFDSGPSGRSEARAAYDACVARHGFIRRTKTN